ncbi:hypothetical protein [Noviherbaspirillum sp. ST9]|uniref:hypothetical protein n=1 Tax=Noviherbaspirillum sp. ST9 TaxID=3401606 RepID=UPI003B587F36
MKETTKQSGTKGFTFPMILILAGLLMFLTRNGLVDRQLVLQLLPLIPVAIGGSLLVSRLRRKAG